MSIESPIQYANSVGRLGRRPSPWSGPPDFTRSSWGNQSIFAQRLRRNNKQKGKKKKRSKAANSIRYTGW